MSADRLADARAVCEALGIDPGTVVDLRRDETVIPAPFCCDGTRVELTITITRVIR